MATTKEKIEKTARKVVGKTGVLLHAAETSVKQQVRKQRARRALRHAGEAALVVGAAALVSATVSEADRALRRSLRDRLSRPLAFEAHLALDHDFAIARVTEALKTEGFGILTRIDVHSTLKEKLGVEFRPYTILGACNPPLAHRALSARADAGLLLPCNVTVEHVPEGGSLVRIADPLVMLDVGGMKEDVSLRAIAAEAHERLERVAHGLRKHGGAVVL